MLPDCAGRSDVLAFDTPVKTIDVVDSHTAGEPTRIITGGFPHVEGKTMEECMTFLETEMDWLRLALMREPRGHRDMFGGILLPPNDKTADAAVVFMDGGRYYNMCGHASLGISAMLIETGRIAARPGDNVVRLETPAGLVESHVEVDQGCNAKAVSVIDVPSFVWLTGQKITVPGIGEIIVDISFGGNFFVIVDADQIGVSNIDPQHTHNLIEIGIRVRAAANAQIDVVHPEKPHINRIDICMITAPPSGPHADGRNIVILGDAQADRSPCGTGTCARLALLHHKGALALGQNYRHESSISSVFDAIILEETNVGDRPAIIPKISCRPFITGMHRFIIHPEDPFAEGFTL